jgi:hypothetical protein
MFDCGGMAFSETGSHASIAIARWEDSDYTITSSRFSLTQFSATQCSGFPQEKSDNPPTENQFGIPQVFFGGVACAHCYRRSTSTSPAFLLSRSKAKHIG